jgi:hypothetical protein
MSIEQTLQKDVEESKIWIEIENEDTTYKRDLAKRIELTNLVLENMKNPDVYICEIIEIKMNEIIDKINERFCNRGRSIA